ncbi:hypothetical protein QMK33_19345 [Hymenobacter sp. H14-R3]|uniref:hypothetical protein n=1 Tax=Hymenobacter sp. H14-R3 TaxID=3046308 RepID=UPI0024B98909|nr:hypothetical protein [Hymenobacter sp. H14-R3]MDJ0367309.1 hypothetical protein [Hymenobacter sp. H14-R3]
MDSQFTPLADVSRQLLQVGTPPAYVFTEGGARYDRDLIALSIQLRIAEAQERIAAALEAVISVVGLSPEELAILEGDSARG